MEKTIENNKTKKQYDKVFEIFKNKMVTTKTFENENSYKEYFDFLLINIFDDNLEFFQTYLKQIRYIGKFIDFKKEYLLSQDYVIEYYNSKEQIYKLAVIKILQNIYYAIDLQTNENVDLYENDIKKIENFNILYNFKENFNMINNFKKEEDKLKKDIFYKFSKFSLVSLFIFALFYTIKTFI